MPCIQTAHANHQLVQSCCGTGCGCDGVSFFANPYCPCNNLDNPAPIQNDCLTTALCAHLSPLAGQGNITYADSTAFYTALNALIATFTTTCTLCPGQTINLIGTTGSSTVVIGIVTPGNPSTIVQGAATQCMFTLSVVSSGSTCLVSAFGSTTPAIFTISANC